MTSPPPPSLPRLPPVLLPSLSDRLERFLMEPELLPVHDGDEIGLFWEPEPQPKRLLKADLSPMETTLKVERDLATGTKIRRKRVSLWHTNVN